jgi:hypothetical protein
MELLDEKVCTVPPPSHTHTHTHTHTTIKPTRMSGLSNCKSQERERKPQVTIATPTTDPTADNRHTPPLACIFDVFSPTHIQKHTCTLLCYRNSRTNVFELRVRARVYACTYKRLPLTSYIHTYIHIDMLATNAKKQLLLSVL